MLSSEPQSKSGGATAGGRLRRALSSHFESRDVTRVFYGAVIGLAVVVALDQSHPATAGQAAAVIAGTALAVGLAEVYSELIGAEVRTRRPLRLSQLRPAAREALAVVFGAGFPTIFFGLAAAGAI